MTHGSFKFQWHTKHHILNRACCHPSKTGVSDIYAAVLPSAQLFHVDPVPCFVQERFSSKAPETPQKNTPKPIPKAV